MLVTSIFSFSQNVFKSLCLKGCYKSGLCGNGLNNVICKLLFRFSIYILEYLLD